MTVAVTTAVISLVPGVVGEAVSDACRVCVCTLFSAMIGEAVGGACRVCVCTLVPDMAGEAVDGACRVCVCVMVLGTVGEAACVCMLSGRAGLTVVTEVVEDQRGEITPVG